jgi:hypothetical protein
MILIALEFGIQYIYTWKCHNETLCIDLLSKQKKIFFKIGGQEGKTGPVWGASTSGRWGGYKERVGEGECSGNIMYSCMRIEK